MAISKIILNGVTQMDLTSDTVAANNLISPNTAHDAAGLPVTGTATAGSNDFIITLTYNSTSEMWEPDSTYAEIIAANTAGKTISATTNNPTVKTSGIEINGSSISYTVSEQTRLPIGTVVVGDVVTIYSLSSSDIVTITASFSLFNTSTATAEPSDVLPGKTFFNSNGSQTGSIQTKTSSDLSASGATVTAPAGYYESAATKTVASGTEGAPTATKGTVSNHSISVTPSVTNTAGYITGGTKTGTAVSVSASELVSGTYTVDSSGTKDVTNYASASVPAGTAGTPSATKGSVSNHSVTVTPSVTNTTGWITGGTNSGTGVTVTASELASGNKAIVDNGTNIDVVGYSTVSVAVPFSTITASSSNPSGGNNGDIWIKTS